MIRAIQEGVDLESVIDNLPSAVIVVNRERRVLVANKMAALFAAKSKDGLSNLRAGEAFGCTNSTLVTEGCGHAPPCNVCIVRNTVIETFKEKAGRSRVEASLTFFDKGRRYLRVTTAFIATASQETVLVALEDVTDERTREQMRLENSKLRAAIETGGAVCHELNQPLMAISGYIELMLLDEDDSSPMHERLKIVQQQIHRISDTTRKLMNITRYKTRGSLNGKIIDLEGSSPQ